MFRYITYLLQVASLARFQNQQPILFIVFVVCSVCFAVVYKIKLKCGYSNKAFSAVKVGSDIYMYLM
jgi:hypothetical protein